MAHPNYVEELGKCALFLQNFTDEFDGTGAKYLKMLQDISNRERSTLDIYLDDVTSFSGKGHDGPSPEFIMANTNRYLKLFAEAADETMPEPSKQFLAKDVFDIISMHRSQQEERNVAQGHAGKLPKGLLRRYDVYIHPTTDKESKLKLRQVSSQHIGHLVKIRGIITHVTDVKPLVTVVAYSDPETGNEIYQEVHGRTFQPYEPGAEKLRPELAQEVGAPGAAGTKRTGRAMPFMETRGSKFVKFQEAKIQELAEEVPEGATPRSISIHFRGEICRSVKPGDQVTLGGIFLPEPYVGFRGMRAGLLTNTFLEVQEVVQEKISYSSHVLTESDLDMINDLTNEGEIYSRLARSIAPEIYGHEDVKKALLLMLVGGTSRVMGDGLKLRGDCHICLMGDPGVAKSQLLKYVSRVSPRAVYTTGKGSSGVGLTAAVLRNQTTKELVLEGGALVLADRGVCCIDEFDKMDESDRTAIHEVMEQQTVSIAKAGITTTLNTRTTILAAANPAWGRYDRHRSAADNINLPAALLSRFDILWLLLDEVSAENDLRLAEHVLTVHRTGRASTVSSGPPPLVPAQLRSYIAAAKKIQPRIPVELTDYIAAVYAEMRQLEKGAAETAATYTTPRTLLSILRLSMAVAKLRFDETVIQSDVDEALRLMRQSKASLISDASRDRERREDPVSLVYRLVRDYAVRNRETTIPFQKIQEITAKYNVSQEDIRTCIEDYANITVWSTTRDATTGQPTVHFPEEDI